MKQLKHLRFPAVALALLLGCTAALAQAPCRASFTSSQIAPNIVAFTSSSTGTTASTHYTWSFGDGYHGSSATTSHTYFNPGLYIVCLKISDTAAGGCHNIYCDTVRVTGVVICHMTVEACSHPASCATCSDGSASVVDIDFGKPPYTYSWSNGATTRTDPNLLPGSYVVCVTDANHCTACDTVTVHARTPHCQAYFYLRRDTTASVTYFAVSASLGVTPFHYLWTWGDGSPADTARHPIHTYAAPGAYHICLTITTANGCTSTWCRTINAHSPVTDPFAPLTVSVIDEPETATGIQEQTTAFSWNLFPNPSSDVATLTYTHADATPVTIDIYDLSGRLVMNLKNVSNECSGEYLMDVNTSTLKDGSYLIRIHTGTQTDTKRLNVAH